MAQPPCPPAERWKAHLDGGLTDDEQAVLTEHLDGCSTCRKTLETLAAGGDSLLDVARQAGEVTDQSNAELQKVMAKFQTAQSETVAEPVAGSLHELHFLMPSEKPGVLGMLGRYEVQKVIGKGGFGIVLKAFDESLHRVVAVKVLSPVYAVNGSARARFIREAKAVAAVKNEHVVGIHDVDPIAQPPYFVMELIDGISLQDKLDRQGALQLKETLRIGMQIAQGLAAAHAQGQIHRDIKPANILLENGVERVKITDFGLARAVDDASVTQSGTVAGTPMYMSPEQAEGLAIDHRSDLFSLGTVLYAMCTGHPPFRASGTHAVLKRVIDASPRAIREINNEIPEWLCDIIGKLHAKKPEERYQSAKEVAELLGARLADVQAGRAIEGRAEGRKAPVESFRSQAPVHSGHGRRLAYIAAIAALVALAFFLHPYLLLFLTNHSRFDITGKSAVDVQWTLSRDGEVVKEFKGLGSQKFDVEPGDYVLKAMNLPPHASMRFEMQSSTLFPRGDADQLEVPVADQLKFTVVRGERVQIDVERIFTKGAVALAKPFFFDQIGLEKLVLRSVEFKDDKFGETGPKVAELQHSLLKQKDSPRVALEPGWYKVEVITKPGYVVTKYEIEKGGQRSHGAGANRDWWRIEVKPGDEITLQVAVEKAKDAPADWVSLFNGKDLAGWNTNTPNAWKVQDNHIVGTNGYLRSAKSFGDFHARVELRMKGTGDIAFRGIANNWVGATLDNSSAIGKTGSLVHELNGKWQVLVDHKNGKYSPDKWFTLEIIARGKKATIKIDGVTTAEQTIERMLDHGYFDFKVERPDGRIEIRKIEIKELPPEGEPWVQLWNGKDFTGWDNKTMNQWSIDTVAGELICSGRAGTPLTYKAKNFRDFHLRCDVEYVQQTQIRVFFRAVPGGERHLQGYASMINSIGNRGSIVLHSDKSTSLHNGAEYRKNEKLPARHQFEVIARGPNITIKEDGEVTAEISDSTFREGLIAFAAAAGHGEARFHRIEIRELSPEPPGWVQLISEDKLTSWDAFTFEKGDAKSAWSVKENVLVGTGAPMGYLHTRKPYENYELSFEWQAPRKPAGQNECLLYLHGQLPHDRLPHAIGINLFEDTKVIHFVSGPDVFSKVSTIEPEFGTKQTGPWQKVDIACKDDAIELKIDGKTRLNGAGFPLRSGFIAIRSAGQALKVRNLKIRSLLASAPIVEAPKEPWVQLFNGKDLSGWKENSKHGKGWKVQDNVLQAVGHPTYMSILSTVRDDYKDFHLRLEMRTHASTRASLNWHTDGMNKRPGYATWLMDVPGTAPIFTLSRWTAPATQKAKPVKLLSTEWYVLEVIARGPRHVIKVNDNTIVAFTDDKPFDAKGTISLLQLMNCGLLEIRKIEIKELLPPEHAFTPLFNGKNYDGWIHERVVKENEIKDHWPIEDKKLGCFEGPSILRTERMHGDYTLQAEFMFPQYEIEEDVMLGKARVEMFLHCPDGPAIKTPYLKLDVHIGGLCEIGRANENRLRDTKSRVEGKPLALSNWHKLMIVAKEDTLEVFVNGQSMGKVKEAGLTRGYIALHPTGIPVWFRNIEIKESPRTLGSILLENPAKFDVLASFYRIDDERRTMVKEFQPIKAGKSERFELPAGEYEVRGMKLGGGDESRWMQRIQVTSGKEDKLRFTAEAP